MANVTYPGVYVEEVASGVRPIAGASTSTAAFIGIAEKGDATKATKVFNFTEYQSLFGGFLDSSWLSHSVYNFFNNGGSQCYIVRVLGVNAQKAQIVIYDRGTSRQPSLTVAASSLGAWGNNLAVVISDGTLDPTNEFDLTVYNKGQTTPLERFVNLSMVPGTANFVENATAGSKFIRVTVDPSNSNVQAGTSRGGGAPKSLPAGRTKFRINLNGDGYQQVDLQSVVGTGTDQVADLSSAANIAAAIQSVVKKLKKLRQSTDQTAFSAFTCSVDQKVLLLRSGTRGLASSVNLSPDLSDADNATGLLNLGRLNGGTETIGAAFTRPAVNPGSKPTLPDSYYLVGDNTHPTAEVASVQAGSDGDPPSNDQPFIDALKRLDRIDDVSLIAIPGIGSKSVVGGGMNYCANRSLSDCFFIGDMDLHDDTIEDAKSFVDGISPKNSYGAVYMPWVQMTDPTGASPEPILVPPSGFVTGLFARTDAQRGVWKAPAGVSAGLGGAVGLHVNFNDVEQGNLNPKNINCIRQFAGSGIVLWGARTLTADPEYLYIPVRRMAIFLRVSIYQGIQWAVFEPNDEPLWAQLRLNITSFMTTLFRRGAFQGATPAQAFFVKCDGETTTQDDINLGIVNVLVGFAPLKPAEFVVVKISQKAGQPA